MAEWDVSDIWWLYLALGKIVLETKLSSKIPELMRHRNGTHETPRSAYTNVFRSSALHSLAHLDSSCPFTTAHSLSPSFWLIPRRTRYNAQPQPSGTSRREFRSVLHDTTEDRTLGSSECCGERVGAPHPMAVPGLQKGYTMMGDGHDWPKKKGEGPPGGRTQNLLIDLIES